MKNDRLTTRLQRLRERCATRNYTGMASRFVWKLLLYVVLFGLCFIIVQPLIQKISTAVMSPQDIFDVSVVYIPKHFSMTFLSSTFHQMEYWKAFLNTAGLCAMVGLLQVFFSALVAYGFARFEFPGRSLLFGLLIFTMVVPPIVILVPQYMGFKNFDVFGIISLLTGKPGGVNLLNTVWPFVLTSMTVMGYKCGLYVYLLRQLYRGLPKELEEAAYIDGCSRLGTYFRIIFPSGRAMMIVCFVFAFVWQWTDSFFLNFYTPNLVTFSKKLTSIVTVTTASIMRDMGMSAEVRPPFGYSVAVGNTAVLLTIIPLLLVFVFAQRFLTESIEQSGLK